MNQTRRILAIGAHPDDCEINCGGTAAAWASAGHHVCFLSMTDGQCGHHELSAASLVQRRKAEAAAAANVADIQSRVLPLPDGHLEPSLDNRLMLIRLIRNFQPDLILTNRPNDYHPDHRYTSLLVQDAAFSLTVPGIAPDTPPLARNPLIMYWLDRFRKPIPFEPDVVVDIDRTWPVKVAMLHEHTSQVYEWLPWLAGRLDEVPADDAERRHWLEHPFLASRDNPPAATAYRDQLIARYGPDRGRSVAHVEAFECCEYGAAFNEVAASAFFPPEL